MRLTCKQCGVGFKRNVSRDEFSQGRGQYCSRGCSAAGIRAGATGRFWRRVHKTEGCWLWSGPKDNDGYGRAYHDGSTWRTNRLAWSLVMGPVPGDKWVLHRCDTPACVRPSHLFLGSHLDNMRDCLMKGRRPSGDAHLRSKLTQAKVLGVRELLSSGVTQRRIAKMYGVSQSAIQLIRSGRTWRVENAARRLV